MVNTEYVTLDGYVVRVVRDLAIGLAKAGSIDGGVALDWVPKSLCRDGDELTYGDEDIEVAKWFAYKEGLDY